MNKNSKGKIEITVDKTGMIHLNITNMSNTKVGAIIAATLAQLIHTVGTNANKTLGERLDFLMNDIVPDIKDNILKLDNVFMDEQL
jgi:hypothetical protein